MITEPELWWAVRQACRRRNMVIPNPKVRAFFMPVIMEALNTMPIEPRLPLTRELAEYLVAKPVEACGILSRIETHVVRLRDDMLDCNAMLRAILDKLSAMDGSHAKGRTGPDPRSG
jgi:hypothetical protein